MAEANITTTRIVDIDQISKLLPALFDRAYTIYGQDQKNKGNFYISDGNLLGLKMAVLPERDTFVFSTYCPANSKDYNKLRRLYRQGVFKTYDCSLCTIQEPDNAILISNEQNQFYVDNQAASVQINQEWEGRDSIRFIVSGTTPQYFYAHLLVTSANHLPMFAVFTDKRVLESILLFMRAGSRHSKNLYSYMNGNSGSDPWHFHMHLAARNEDPFLRRCIEKTHGSSGGVIEVERGIVRAAVFHHKDLDTLINGVNNNMGQILTLRDKEGALITSNFFFADDKFFVVVYVGKGQRNSEYTSLTGEKCKFILILASCQLFPVSCFTAPNNKKELDHFLTWVNNTYGNIYISSKQWGVQVEPSSIDKWSQGLTRISEMQAKDVIMDPHVDNLYVVREKTHAYPRRVTFGRCCKGSGSE